MPTAIDLFCGAGGFSLGAARAGFSMMAAIDSDKIHLATHATNFPQTRHLNEDISSLSGRKVLQQIGVKIGEIDCVLGGPPCQGFSIMGRQHSDDARSRLFIDFFRIVSEIKPAFFVAENVPGILQESNRGILKQAYLQLPSYYRFMEPYVLSASDFGAPTVRTRVFFIGYDSRRLGSFNPWNELLLLREKARPTYVGEALHGLPLRISPEWQTDAEQWRTVRKVLKGFYGNRIQACVPRFVGDMQALKKYRKENLVSGFLGTVHTPSVLARLKELAPGETDPISRCPRLSKNSRCPTLRAGTRRDKGSFQSVRPIHPTQDRVITPREAARLQGFPDWYQFHPTKWHSFMQIGNSVSPFVAEALMVSILRAISSSQTDIFENCG